MLVVASKEVGKIITLIGAIVAMILSYETNHSIGWCALHGLCSWPYVIYSALSSQGG